MVCDDAYSVKRALWAVSGAASAKEILNVRLNISDLSSLLNKLTLCRKFYTAAMQSA